MLLGPLCLSRQLIGMKLARYNANWILHIDYEAIVCQPVVVHSFSVKWVVIHAHDGWLPPLDCALLSVFVSDDKLLLRT